MRWIFEHRPPHQSLRQLGHHSTAMAALWRLVGAGFGASADPPSTCAGLHESCPRMACPKDVAGLRAEVAGARTPGGGAGGQPQKAPIAEGVRRFHIFEVRVERGTSYIVLRNNQEARWSTRCRTLPIGRGPATARTQAGHIRAGVEELRSNSADLICTIWGHIWPKSGPIWINIGQVCSTSANLGASLARFGFNSTNIGRFRPDPDHARQCLTNFRPALGLIWSLSTKSGPTPTNFGQRLPHLGQRHLGQTWPASANL